MPDFKPDVIHVEALEKLSKALKRKPPVCKVGILANKNIRKPEEGKKPKKNPPGNAEIGAAHEYGAPKRGLPQRSFLRVPLIDRLDKTIEQSGLGGEEAMKEVLKAGSLKPWLETVANLAEGIVTGAFASNGYGKWKAWKGNYTSSTGQILVETTQLKGSISHEIKGD